MSDLSDLPDLSGIMARASGALLRHCITLYFAAFQGVMKKAAKHFWK